MCTLQIYGIRDHDDYEDLKTLGNEYELGGHALSIGLEDSAITNTCRYDSKVISAGHYDKTGIRHSHEEDRPLDILTRLKLRTVGESCSTCAAGIKRSIEKMEGVKSVTVNPVLDLVFVDYLPHLTNADVIIEAIGKIGYKTVPVR